jgi:hypothetical protein
MEEARVLIDLKEGVIELQGPVDFVRHYLEIYQPSIKGLQITPRGAAASPEKPKRSSRRSKKTAKRVSCTAAIRKELESGFFSEPRSIGDIKSRLKEAGFEFSDGNTRNSLKRLTSTGTLSANGEGRRLTYSKAGL